jgi:branched-chain amino acid transport system permease protein
LDYFLHVLVLIAIYSILAISLDLLVGKLGMLSLCHGAFYGLGAYVSVLLELRGRWPLLPSLVTAMIFTAVLSLAVSLPSLRLREDYFVITSLGFQMILVNVLTNWESMTRGVLGIPSIPLPRLAGAEPRLVSSALAASGLGVAYLTVNLLSVSPFGRVLRGIRQDETFVASVGRNLLRFKVTAFAVSAALAAYAGCVYAHYVTYIEPSNFTVAESILVVSMVAIGGADSRFGPIVGAATLVLLPEVLALSGIGGPAAANFRQITMGTLLVVMMFCRPRGLVGRYGFER